MREVETQSRQDQNKECERDVSPNNVVICTKMDEFADDFAFLSDDIVHDVLQFAHFERLRENILSMKPLGGRWGEIAEKFSYFKFVNDFIVESRLDGNSTRFALAANSRNNLAVNSIRLSVISDFNKIEHLASSAYESLEVYRCKVIPKILENLGTRFTKIIWSSGNENETNDSFFSLNSKNDSMRLKSMNTKFTSRQRVRLQEEFQWNNYLSSARREGISNELGISETRVKTWFRDRSVQQSRLATNRNQQIRSGNTSWVPMDGETDFLTRQLKSPHLRTLECDSTVLARPEFTDLLVDFVRKKNFQTLKSTSSKCLSPEVFVAAYEAWLQRSEREHLLSSISARISTEDLRKLTAICARDKHPTANHYETLMTSNLCLNGTYELTMEFSRDSIKY